MTTQTATAPVTARTCSPEGRVTRSLLGYGPLAVVCVHLYRRAA